jgi:hypothetical protein
MSLRSGWFQTKWLQYEIERSAMIAMIAREEASVIYFLRFQAYPLINFWG